MPQDYVQAYMWYKLGAANGGKSGAVLRDELAIRMTSDQIFAAQKLAREWKPKPYEAPRTKRNTMSIEETTVSNMWEIAARVEVFEPST